jgi:RNA polymerase sigma-70 factor (ECF subfamily)
VSANNRVIEVLDPASPAPGPVEQIEAQETREAIRRALETLPVRQREAITLFAFEQMPYREIAQVMEMPVNTVKTLIHRGRVGLAHCLETLRKEHADGL